MPIDARSQELRADLDDDEYEDTKNDTLEQMEVRAEMSLKLALMRLIRSLTRVSRR